MWDREPGSEMFSVVRVGVGKVKLAMTLELPEIARAADLEPATGHALRKFLNAQEYVGSVPKAIWLQRFPGLSMVGDIEQGRALVRAMLCQLAAFHSPADVQVVVVTAAPSQWEWAKWLPHFQHETLRDGCGECRMLFSSPAELEAFFDSDPDGARAAWSAPSSSMSAGSAGVLPLRVVVDDHCATPEDWAGLTGAVGYAGTCFVRVAEALPPRPAAAVGAGAKCGRRVWSLDEPVPIGSGDVRVPRVELVQSPPLPCYEVTDPRLVRLVGELSERERMMLWAWLKEGSWDAAAESCGASRSEANNVRRRVKRLCGRLFGSGRRGVLR
jgi:DNA segregation ATPase FtsK/SpoIIIE-like protein